MALLIVGGLVFWELQARGHLVSGGLFKDVQVNESLLLAPVLFLAVVALVFMRFFPLFVRFISGDSPGLLHLVFGATVVTLALFIVAREVKAGDELGWLAPVTLLALLAAVYWGTHRAPLRLYRIGGLALQAGLVASVVFLEPPVVSDASISPTISLLTIVPAQVVFLLLRGYAQIAPVWLALGLRHMARNPFQYTWLVLLLVLVTGLGFLATTVGGTLDRSQRERILYDVAADYRVSRLRESGPGGEALRDSFVSIPGVTSAAMAFRAKGRVGALFKGTQFDLLALESEDFPYISWYREDFSDRPLGVVMQALQYNVLTESVVLPEGATSVGVWVDPRDVSGSLALWFVLQDGRGTSRTVTLGDLGTAGWQLMRAKIPVGLEEPIKLVAVQLFEMVLGPAATPGSIRLDNIHATVGPDEEERLLDDFEGRTRWTSLATSMISTDSIQPTTDDVYSGKQAGIFRFGKENDGGIRGFYQSPSGGPVPVVASSSFMAATSASIGDELIVKVRNRLIPIVVRDTVGYFPTLDPSDGGFLLAELDSVISHMNILSPRSAFRPNELFIAKAPDATDSVRELVLGRAPVADLVKDKEFLLTSLSLDPLVTAGWKAMVLLSVGVIVFTAGLGYVTYLLQFADRSRSEMGFLQAFGLSRRQMMGLLSLEHLVIVIIGLGLGTWAGFQMSTRMVASVAVTEKGEQVLPPFILVTDWSVMLLIYGLLIGIFLAALYRLNRSMLHLDLQTISRLEG